VIELSELHRWTAAPATEGGASTLSAAESTAGLVLGTSAARAPGPEEAPTPGRALTLARERAERAERQLAEARRAALIERVCREEGVPASVATLASAQLADAARAGEGPVREAARRLVEIDRERQAAGAAALRESLGIDRVEGAGPRGPVPWYQNGGGTDVLAAMGLYGGDR